MDAAKHTVPVRPGERVEQITIVTNPSFGAALKFMLFGALLGAGAMWLLAERRTKSPSVPPPGNDRARAQREAEHLESRTARISRRVQNVARQAKVVAGFAADTLGPAIGAAVSEGRKAAHDMEGALRKDLKNHDEDEVEKV